MTGVSGIDTESIVSQMMAVERRPQDLMKTKVASMQKAQTAWQSIADKLVALKTASDGLAALGAAANLRTVTSSIPAQVAVRSIGSGANGSSSVDVLRLATSHAMLGADVFTSTSDSIGARTLTLTKSGGSPVAITSTDGTVAGLAAAVNAADMGVSAKVLQTSPGRYQLSLTADTSGVGRLVHRHRHGVDEHRRRPPRRGRTAEGRRRHPHPRVEHRQRRHPRRRAHVAEPHHRTGQRHHRPRRRRHLGEGEGDRHGHQRSVEHHQVGHQDGRQGDRPRSARRETPYDASQPPGPKGLPQHIEINFGVTDPADRQPGDPIMTIIPVTAYEQMWDRRESVRHRYDHQDLLIDGGAPVAAAHLRNACASP